MAIEVLLRSEERMLPGNENCRECTRASGCAWCESTNTCLQTSGDRDGKCPGAKKSVCSACDTPGLCTYKPNSACVASSTYTHQWPVTYHSRVAPSSHAVSSASPMDPLYSHTTPQHLIPEGCLRCLAENRNIVSAASATHHTSKPSSATAATIPVMPTTLVKTSR